MPNILYEKVMRKIFLVVLDIIGCVVMMYLAFYLVNKTDLIWRPEFLLWVTVTIGVTVVVYMLGKLYRNLWEYASIMELIWMVLLAFLVNVILVALSEGLNTHIGFRTHIIYTVLSTGWTLIVRSSYRISRYLKQTDRGNKNNGPNVLLIGAGEAGVILLREMKRHNDVGQIVAIIDDNQGKWGSYIYGVKVVGGKESIVKACVDYGINEIFIAIPSAKASLVSEIIKISDETGCHLKIVPGVYTNITQTLTMDKLRDVEVEDLLGRDIIDLDMEPIAAYLENKKILVTGGGGSIGSELCRQISKFKPSALYLFDIYENGVYDLQLELKRNFPEMNIRVDIGSVRDKDRLTHVFGEHKPDVVFHAAAHKHVPLMEDSPGEAIKNNVFGTMNVAECAGVSGAERFVMISTDKAVNPTNIMGASKRLAEMAIQALKTKYDTNYVVVRFGNVLGSNGSVVPIFKRQIAQGGPVTVMHKDIIRYFMTIPEAAQLVLQAGTLAKDGEVFVLDMGEPVKIDDLARRMIHLSGLTPDVDIKISYVGLRPGEKMYEELLVDKQKCTFTRYEKIFIEQPDHVVYSQLMESLNTLFKLTNGEPDDIKNYVKRLVPSYKDSSEVNGFTVIKGKEIS